MTIEQKGDIIRCMATALLIAEYQLLKLVDDTHQDLKVRTKNAIASCRRVQDYFLKHPNATPETKATFKENFLGGEIVLLTELLEKCFNLPEQSLEDIINAISQNTETTNHV